MSRPRTRSSNGTKRRNRSAYDRLFLAGDGHLGYQTPNENMELFRGAGFRIVEHRGLEKTWACSPSVYAKLATFGGLAEPLFRLAAQLGRSPWLYPYVVLLRLLDVTIVRWLPERWSRVDLVVCEVPITENGRGNS